MDENTINQYAFEIFSRARIFESEFKVFQAEQKLANLPEQHRSEMTIIQNEASINAHKCDLEKRQTQLQQFKESKEITN